MEPQIDLGTLEIHTRQNPRDPRGWLRLGIVLAKARRYDESIPALMNCLKLEPHNREANFNLALALFKLQRYQEAVLYFQEYLQVNPDHERANFYLGLALHYSRRISEAVNCYNKALRINPQHAGYWFTLGSALGEMGHYEAALDKFSRARDLEPSSLRIIINQGMTLNCLKRYDDAVIYFQDAIHLDPMAVEAHLNLGSTLFVLNRIDEGLIHYERVLQIDPDNAESHYNLGIGMNKKGLYEVALRHFETVMNLNPDFPDIHFSMGVALENLGCTEQAIIHFRQQIRQNPDGMLSDHARTVLKRLLASLDGAQAQHMLNSGAANDQAVLSKTQYINSKKALGKVNVAEALSNQRNREDEALALLSEALEIDPACIPAHDLMAHLLIRMGRQEESIDHVKKALELNPNDKDAPLNHFNLAVYLEALGRIEEAEYHYQQMLSYPELSPEKIAHAQHKLGVISVVRNNSDAALAYFKKAADLVPDSAVYQNDCACIMVEMNDVANAIPYLERALKADPTHVDRYTRLAEVLIFVGDSDKALHWLKKASVMNVEMPTIYYLMAVACFKKEAIPEGKNFLEKVLGLNPKHEFANELMATLN